MNPGKLGLQLEKAAIAAIAGKKAVKKAGKPVVAAQVKALGKDVQSWSSTFESLLSEAAAGLGAVVRKAGFETSNRDLALPRKLLLRSLATAKTTDEALRVQEALIKGLPYKLDHTMRVPISIQASALERAADLIASKADAQKVAGHARFLSSSEFALTNPFSFWKARQASNKAAAYLATAIG